MRTITVSELVRATQNSWDEVMDGWVVVFDRAAESGGVSMPAGFGETEADAREAARKTARKAGVPGASLDGEAFLIVPD